MIDSFIEGDIKLDEILNKMNEEKKSHKQGGAAHAAAIRDNKKITEMFEGQPKSKVTNAADASKSGFFTLNDFLDDMSDTSSKPSNEDQQQPFYIKSKTSMLHQLSLNTFT